MVIKTKLRVCEICGVKKKVAEFSTGKICNKCETDDDDAKTNDTRTDDTVDNATNIDGVKDNNGKAANNDLHMKIDLLSQRLERMEALMLGLMELVGKINYDMEMDRVED